jgi:protein TonB
MGTMFKKVNTIIAAAIACSFAFGIASTSVSADEMSGWKKAVAKKVAKKQKYPRSAISKEIEGRAKVRLTVSADGAITAHEIVEPTGEKVLDREIPKLVNRLNPLPALPAGQAEFSFLLPLNWRLD